MFMTTTMTMLLLFHPYLSGVSIHLYGSLQALDMDTDPAELLRKFQKGCRTQSLRLWIRLCSTGGSKNFEGGAEDNLSAPSSFIANVHNEIYAFYTEKKRLFAGRPHRPPPL